MDFINPPSQQHPHPPTQHLLNYGFQFRDMIGWITTPVHAGMLAYLAPPEDSDITGIAYARLPPLPHPARTAGTLCRSLRTQFELPAQQTIHGMSRSVINHLVDRGIHLLVLQGAEELVTPAGIPKPVYLEWIRGYLTEGLLSVILVGSVDTLRVLVESGVRGSDRLMRLDLEIEIAMRTWLNGRPPPP